jgi:hypothetical protein
MRVKKITEWSEWGEWRVWGYAEQEGLMDFVIRHLDEAVG